MKSLSKKYMGGYNDINRRKDNINIYQGGKVYSRTVGEESEFILRDILISIKYFDLSIIQKKTIKGKRALKLIHNTFILNSDETSIQDIFDEIDYLLSLSNEELAQIYSKKFKLHMPFSDVLKPLFMFIKEYFESLIKKIYEDLEIDTDKYIDIWENINENLNIKSSSVILYQLGKDKDFIKELTLQKENIYNKFKEYITNEKKWSYMGWCPNAPSIRMKHLMEFPLGIVFQILEPNHKDYIEAQYKYISNVNLDEIFLKIPIELPPSKLDIKIHKKDTKKKQKLTQNMIEKKIKNLIVKLNDIKDLLIKWEDYYILFAKIYSAVSSEFQSKNSV